MKKIIAMLLCVAMVAAFAVSAFAAGPFVLHGKDSYIGDYYTKDWEDAMDDVFGASYLEGYAKQLSAAKKALAKAKKDLADMQAAAIDAIAVAQNYAVATMYEAAMYQLEADVDRSDMQERILF